MHHRRSGREPRAASPWESRRGACSLRRGSVTRDARQGGLLLQRLHRRGRADRMEGRRRLHPTPAAQRGALRVKVKERGARRRGQDRRNERGGRPQGPWPGRARLSAPWRQRRRDLRHLRVLEQQRQRPLPEHRLDLLPWRAGLNVTAVDPQEDEIGAGLTGHAQRLAQVRRRVRQRAASDRQAEGPIHDESERPFASITKLGLHEAGKAAEAEPAGPDLCDRRVRSVGIRSRARARGAAV
mmetsp:Transcript_63326/g.182180  ORF Transcript_63326/g.182180 Transcript_63326/m.182180 type:complete len:241 (+) Transcript_63326:1019-1741(+)